MQLQPTVQNNSFLFIRNPWKYVKNVIFSTPQKQQQQQNPLRIYVKNRLCVCVYMCVCVYARVTSKIPILNRQGL